MKSPLWFALAVVLFACRPTGTGDAPPSAVAPVESETLSEGLQYTDRLDVSFPVAHLAMAKDKGIEVWRRRDAKTWEPSPVLPVRDGRIQYRLPGEGRHELLLIPVSLEGKRLYTPAVTSVPEHTVVVDTNPPVVEVLGPNGREVFAPGWEPEIHWLATDPNLKDDSITLELSTDAGASWTVLASGLPNDGMRKVRMPDISTLNARVRVSAADRLGHAASDESDADFVLDGIPPKAQITGPARVDRVPALLDYTAVDPGGAGVQTLHLFVTVDGGRTWMHFIDVDGAEKAIPFAGKDGVYGLTLVGTDKVGNRGVVPTPGTPPGFQVTLATSTGAPPPTEPPPVVVEAPLPAVPQEPPVQTAASLAEIRIAPNFSRDARLGPGEVIKVAWQPTELTDRAREAFLRIRVEQDGRVVRETKAKGMSTSIDAPTEAGSYLLRLELVDADGVEIGSNQVRFSVKGSEPAPQAHQAPEVRITKVDRIGRAFTIHVALQADPPVPVDTVIVWSRRSGTSLWEKLQEETAREARSGIVQVIEGSGDFELAVTARDRAGVASPDPDASTKGWPIRVEDQQPTSAGASLTLETMKGGEYYAAGMTKMIGLSSEGVDPATLQVEVSDEAGVEGTWQRVPQENLKPMPGGLLWRGMPTKPARTYRIRVSTPDGRTASATSSGNFTIDNQPPTIQGTGPAKAFERVKVEYTETPSLAPIETRTLWWTLDGGRTLDYQVFSADQPVEFFAGRPGRYGLYLTARSRAGLSSESPKEGSPFWMVEVETGASPQPGRLTLEIRSSGTAFKGGAEIEVVWKSQEETEGATVQLALEMDDAEIDQRTGTNPATGSTKWKLPMINSRRCRFRATLFDAGGRRIDRPIFSNDFTVDSEAPEVSAVTVAEAKD